jgi:hypothetical protein
LTALEALLGPPWAVEHGGGHRLAGDLAIGEILAVRRLPCPVWLPGGPVWRVARLSVSCVSSRLSSGVHVAFERSDSKSI